MQNGEFDERTVTVELPSHRQFARLARTTAAACCALEGLSVDTRADVRLLVDEVFEALASIACGPIWMMLTPGRGIVVLAMTTAPRPGCDWDSVHLPMLEAMAGVVVTDPVFDRDDDLMRFTAVVREGPPA